MMGENYNINFNDYTKKQSGEIKRRGGGTLVITIFKQQLYVS